jgi:uncharacterized protein Yka (UPF0111/DUF47 family)
MSIFSRFIPNNNQAFFDLFNQGSSNVMQMATLLHSATVSDNIDNQQNYIKQVAFLGTQSYQIKHQVYAISGRSFVSPFERNDMYALASAIKKVADHIDVSARRISLYQVEVLSPAMKELTGLIADSCAELEKAILHLQNMSNSDAITACCVRIKELEHYADKVYGKAFASLIEQETDTVQLIKQSDILGALERATDKCENASTVIESILIKNS